MHTAEVAVIPEPVLSAELGELDGVTSSCSYLGVVKLLCEAYVCDLAERAIRTTSSAKPSRASIALPRVGHEVRSGQDVRPCIAMRMT